MSKTSIDKIPKVATFLKSKTHSNLFSKENGQGPILDTENIIAVTDTLGNTNYSIGFILPRAEDDKDKKLELFNLTVAIDTMGRMSNPMVLKLTPNSDNVDEWLDNDLDFAHFDGKVALHKYTDYFSSNPISRPEEYCPPEHDANGDPVECIEDQVSGGGTGTGSGGSYAPSGGSGNGCSYSMYWNYCGGTNETVPHPGGPPPICGGDGSGAGWVLETSCPNYNDITYFYKNGSGASKSDCPDCSTGPSGSNAINTYDRSVIKLEYYLDYHFDYTLSYSQLTWLNLNPDRAYAINQPLKTYGFTSRNLALATAKIDAYMAEETTDFSNRLTKMANGTAVSAFPFIKYPDNKAAQYRNDYPKLTEYLENQLPKLAKNETIVNAFKKYTNMTESQIETLLKWDDGPTLVIKQLGSDSGHFTEPDTLEIDIDLANNLENATSGSEYSENVLFAVAVTILHEAVHYGDFTYNNDYYQGNMPCINEEGWLFESEVYGSAAMVKDNGELIIVPLDCN